MFKNYVKVSLMCNLAYAICILTMALPFDPTAVPHPHFAKIVNLPEP